MRILFCNFEYPPLGGGGGVFTALLAEEMSKRHKVTVLTSRGAAFPTTQSVENGVKVVRIPVFFSRQEPVANLWSMLMFIPNAIEVGKRLLGSDRYDIVNTHFVLPTGPVGDALSRFAGIPNVLSLHGGDLYDPSKATSPHRSPLLRMWIKRLLRRSAVVVGQSTNTLENARRFYAPDIEGVRVPLGIKRPNVGAGSRMRYGFGDDEFLFVTVGRLVARKAISQLLAMMQALKGTKARLLIIGTGPQERLLKREAMERQLGDRVVFMGQVGEVEKFEILQMCDLYVTTSQHEGFGLVFLESMACGIPIVCYDHGGQTDFLQDHETGFLVPLNRLDLFQKRCGLLMNNPELRRKMGDYNKRAVEQFYIDQGARKYEALFNRALEARAAKPAAAVVEPKTGRGTAAQEVPTDKGALAPAALPHSPEAQHRAS